MARRTFQKAQSGFVMVFFMLTALPLVLMLVGVKGVVAVSENRALAALPGAPRKVGQFKNWFSSMDAYLADHFGLRAELLTLAEWPVLRVLKQSTSISVLLGKDGWLVYRDGQNLDDYRNVRPFSEAELRAWGDYVKEQRRSAAEIGAQFILMVGPNNVTIYGDRALPDWVIKRNPRSRLDQLKEALAHDGISIADPRERLMENRDRERLYYKTDTHWTPLGAYYGYQALAEAMGLKAEPPESFQMETATVEHMDLTNMLGALPIAESVVQPKKKKGEAMLETLPVRGAGPEIKTRCESCGHLSTVVYRDSSFTSVLPYLSERLAFGHFIWDERIDWPEIRATAAKRKIDFVVWEFVERRVMGPAPMSASERM